MAEIDDLWVEPFQGTEADRDAVRQFIREYREHHPQSESEHTAQRARFKERFGIDVADAKSSA